MRKFKFTSSNIDDCVIKNFGILDKGSLLPIDLSEIPFAVKRVFIVHGSKGIIRGEHAHLECEQFLICMNGRLKVSVDDGIIQKSHLLLKGDSIFLPIGIWSIQEYLDESSSIIVMCSHEYNESEYIRDYSMFLSMKEA